MRAAFKLARLGVAASGLVALVLHAQPDPPAPVFTNVTVHDPSVVRDGSTYYVFGSHLAAASTADLIHWTQVTSSMTSSSLIKNGTPLVEFATAFAYSTVQDFWAPDAIKLTDGNYYYYYCTCQGSSPLSALGLAKAAAITGPYANVGLMLKSAGASPTVAPYDVNTMPNVVDPSVFFDHTGKLWMVYGSFSGGIFILPLDSTAGSPTIGQPIAGNGYGKKLIGGNSSRIEGAYIIYSPETAYYYLFMTFGGLDAAGGYNIRVGRSLNPDGPYLDAAGNDLTNVKGNFAFDDATIAPYGVKLMGGYQFLHVSGEPGATSRGYLSPGGCSINRDAATGKYFLVFHTRFVGQGEVHEVRVHQLFLNLDGWFVAAPQRYAGETIAATDAGRIVGNYKLINHGKAITATVSTSSNISLLSDGTVTGAVTGTWQLSGSHDASLTLAGVTYHGEFLRAWDDDTQVWVLTFTALSGNGVAVWGSKIAINTVPAFLTSPASQTVTAGASVTLTAVASGDPAPTYQWKKGGIAIGGATGSSYPLASTVVGDTGNYTVVATNTAGTVTSNAAALTVNAGNTAPAITLQPVNHTVTAGGTTSFTVTASGIPTPAFQWKKNGVNIAGATSATLSLSNVQPADAASYTAVATNTAGTATSTAATLTVNVAPAFTTQPLSQTVPVGGAVTFSVGVSGSPAPTYQWQVSADGGTTWTNLANNNTYSGATTASLTLSGTSASLMDLQYRCVTVNTVGTVNSQPVILALMTACANFNHDGFSDILWHNTSTGLVSSWTTNSGFLVFGTEGGGWSVIGTGDFDGDGQADALWHNTSTGLVASWTSGGGFMTFGVEGGGWYVSGTGDFDGDHKTDVLWHNTSTGLVASWTSSAGFTTYGTEGGGWAVIAAADFDGDGKTDLLWHNLYTGAVSAVYTAGGGLGLGTEGGGWYVCGVGDFDADGKADVLWHNIYTGVVSAVYTAGGGLGLGTEGGGWEVIGTGDFDGDGKADVLWRNTATGLVASWTSSGGFTVFGVEGGGWSVID